MSKTITAIYESPQKALEASDRLEAQGVSRDDISILMSDQTRGRTLAIETKSKTPEGAAAGAVTGGALGGLAAGLVGVGTLATGGVGLVAAGPIVAALAGAGAGGAVGTLVGGLVGYGVPENEATFYADKLENGGVLLAVEAHDDRVDTVEELLDTDGAVRVNT